jgi:hypothetical protein
MNKFARMCSVTGEGMNEGYVFSDGEFYAKDEDTAKVIALREYGMELSDMFTDDDDDDWDGWAVYWTEWEDEDDYQYEMIDGVLTEIQD